MADHPRSSVGLRELRHETREVLDRVRSGETVDVTDRGQLIARLVPADEPTRPEALVRLVAAGRVQLATRPGLRPRRHRGDGTDRLGDALAASRDDER